MYLLLGDVVSSMARWTKEFLPVEAPQPSTWAFEPLPFCLVSGLVSSVWSASGNPQVHQQAHLPCIHLAPRQKPETVKFTQLRNHLGCPIHCGGHTRVKVIPGWRSSSSQGHTGVKKKDATDPNHKVQYLFMSHTTFHKDWGMGWGGGGKPGQNSMNSCYIPTSSSLMQNWILHHLLTDSWALANQHSPANAPP